MLNGERMYFHIMGINILLFVVCMANLFIISHAS